MYSGDYLKQGNLGHEVINLYKSDNGNNYIYLSESGEINKTHSGKIYCVLLVRGVGNRRLEITGKAEGIEEVYGKVDQGKYIGDNHISYGGALLSNIFRDNKSHQDICITFKADRVLKPAKPIYIQYGENENGADVVTLLDVNQARQSLKKYIHESYPNDYKTLADIINNDSLWGEEVGYVSDTGISDMLPTTMFGLA